MDEDKALLALNERRAARALDKAPDLVSYIRSLVVPAGAAAQDGTPRAPKADPPLPFRAEAVDDADSLFGTLLDWAERWLRVLPVIPCEVRAWRLQYGEDVSGMPANVTVAGSYAITNLVCRWLLRHHILIARLDAGIYFEDVADRVGELRAKYPMAPRPPRRALRRVCPVCGEFAVVARIPQDPRDTEVVCEQCGYEIPYESYAELVEGWLR